MTTSYLLVEGSEKKQGERISGGRRLVFCFDGSWNKLDTKQYPTNVVLVAESVPPVASDGRDQIVYYDEGVGTASDDTFRGGAFGKGLIANVQEAYRFLIFNYRPGDEIFVFGFSRGAFTARTFIGFIKCAGIMSVNSAAQVRRAWELYRQHASNDGDDAQEVLEFRAEHCPHLCVSEAELAWRRQRGKQMPAHMVKVRYCGVWDTVGSLGWKAAAATFDRRPDKRYKQHDTQLSSLVEGGRHAVALDERRVHFMPTLWRNVHALNAQAGHDPYSENAPYQEKWFPGDHGSVGGGGPERGLSNAALHWVLKGALDLGLEIDLTGRSQLSTIRYDASAPLRNTPADGLRRGNLGRYVTARGIAFLKDKLLTSSRSGPVEIDDVHPAALRKWFLASANGKGAAYRPKALGHLERDVEARREIFDPPAKDDYPAHTVRPGESLYRIARRLLGDPGRMNEIFALNRDLIDDADDIFPGDKLRLPMANAAEDREKGTHAEDRAA